MNESWVFLTVDELDTEDFSTGEGCVYGDGGRNRCPQ